MIRFATKSRLMCRTSDLEGFRADLTLWLQSRNVNAATVMAETRREAAAKCEGQLSGPDSTNAWLDSVRVELDNVAFACGERWPQPSAG